MILVDWHTKIQLYVWKSLNHLFFLYRVSLKKVWFMQFNIQIFGSKRDVLEKWSIGKQKKKFVTGCPKIRAFFGTPCTKKSPKQTHVIFWHWIQKCNFYGDRVKGVQNSPLKQICPSPLLFFWGGEACLRKKIRH